MNTVQDAVRDKGLEIFRQMEAGPPEIFDTRTWSGILMNLAMKDPELKVRLFRFVDVLPALTTPEQVVGHIREYFLDGGDRVPKLLRRLLGGIETGLAASITAELVRKNIIAFSRTFIAGESPEDGARRELREETGYAPGDLEHIGFLHADPAIQGNTLHMLVARDCQPAGPTDQDDGEDVHVRLFDVEQVRAMARDGRIRHALAVAVWHYVESTL